jgi:2-haloacid dehalogenase
MTPLILLDTIETCLSLDPLRTSLFRLGLGDAHLELWHARALREAFAREIVGDYLPFEEVLVDALETMVDARHLDVDRDELAAIVDGFSELPPHADVRPALERARAGTLRVAFLTNTSEQLTRKVFDRANLLDLVDWVVSGDQVEHYKPAREVYLHAARVLGGRPESCVMVSAHGWDLRGALSAGLGAAYVQRGEAITPDLANEVIASRPSLQTLFADLEQLTVVRRSA